MPPRPGEAQPAHPSERLIIACPSACLSICLSVHLSICPSVQHGLRAAPITAGEGLLALEQPPWLGAVGSAGVPLVPR